MDNLSNHAIRFAQDETPEGRSSTNWYVLLLAVILTLFAVYWGFVRPTSRQLTKLRRYVTSLESSIAELNGQRPKNDATLSLLEQLVQQERLTADAVMALDEMNQLHRQLVHEADQLVAARQALDGLAELRTSVAHQASLIDATDRALESASDLHVRVQAAASDTENAARAVVDLTALRDGLIYSIERLEDTKPILASVEQLHSRLANSVYITEQARVVSDNLLSIEEDLINRGSDAESAQLALNDLIDLRDELEAQSTSVDKANATLDQMVGLQSNVLAQTEMVVTALETLELSSDVSVEMQRAGATLNSMKRMLTEMVLLTPTLKQASDSLQPLVELSNLRRLGVRELRQVANVIMSRHSDTAGVLAEPAEIVADANDATVK